MAKAKLTVASNFDNFKVACEVKDVQVIEHTKYGEVNVCVVNYKHPSQLYEIGFLQHIVGKPEAIKAAEKPVIKEEKKS